MVTQPIRVIAMIALLTGVAAAEEAPESSEAWAAPHERGNELYQRGSYASAVVEFEQARQLGAPAPNLYNLARAYQQLGQLRHAVEVFDEYLATPGLPDERRTTAREHREEASSALAHITVRSAPPGATIAVVGDDSIAGVTPATIELDPGEHQIQVSLEHHETATRQVGLDPGEQEELALTLTPVETPPQPPPEPATPQPPTPPERERRWRGGPWVLFGAGVVVALTGVAFWAAAYSQSLQEEPFGSIDDYNWWTGWTYDMALAGDVVVSVGSAAALAGVIWLALDRVRERRSSSSRGLVAASVTPLAGGLGVVANLRL